MFLLSTGKFLFLSCPRATFPLNLFLPPNNKVLSLPPSCCFFNNPLVSSIIAWQHVWIHCIAGVSEKDTFVREQTDRKHRKRKGHTELLEWERPDTLADELQESTVTHHITAKKKKWKCLGYSWQHNVIMKSTTESESLANDAHIHAENMCDIETHLWVWKYVGVSFCGWLKMC